jgi:hypothetical protein
MKLGKGELEHILKLGKGELEHILKDGSSLSMQDARDYFLFAVKKVAPDVLDDLAGEPFTLYKAAGLAFDRESFQQDIAHLEPFDQIRESTRRDQNHVWDHPDWYGFEDHEIDYDSNLAALQKSIFDWSERHNLDANWCRERAFETLDSWYQSSGSRENRTWRTYNSMQTIVPDRNGLHFQFSIKSVYPASSFRKQEKERITEHFERELKAFLDGRERRAIENGMKRPKQKHDGSHFEWFAFYQVKLWTGIKIQKHFNKEKATVDEAIKSVRNLLTAPNDPGSELKRPDGKTGRPRKQ